MSQLVCDSCDPREPLHGEPYYPIDRIVVAKTDGVVDADSGNVRRTDHRYKEETLLAECSQCGSILLDKSDSGLAEML
jgi:protein-arginine kinase activator protein McsA